MFSFQIVFNVYWNSFKYFIIIVLMSFFRFWIGPIGGKLNRFTSKVRSIHLHWCKIFLRKRIDTFGCVLLLQVGVSCWWMKLWIVECAWVLWWQRAGKDDRCTRWSNLSTIGTIRSSWSCANRLHVIIEFRHWCSWAGLTLSARSILRLQFTVRNGATWWFSIAFKVVLRFACLELRWKNDEWIQTIQFVVLGIKNMNNRIDWLTTDSVSHSDPHNAENGTSAFLGKWMPGINSTPKFSQKWSASRNDQRETRLRAQWRVASTVSWYWK